MRTIMLVPFILILVSCSNSPEYKLTRTSKDIAALQVLDPEASVNNDGITRELQGDYGKHAAENYRDSIYVGKEGRAVKSQDDGK